MNLLGALQRKKVIDTVQLNMLLQQVYSFRDGFAMLYVYDWVKIPLVYTQVGMQQVLSFAMHQIFCFEFLF